jgi:hypothetical protein
MQVLAQGGYGLWLLLGMALALRLYPAGRGDALVPLALGAALVGAGALASLLHLPLVPDWLGWRFGRGSRPNRRAMLAMVTFLPMLGLAGLVRGDNQFWATRLSGAVLACCSLACLAYVMSGTPGRPEGRLHILGRVVSACYAGGLWLWLCLISQDGAEPRLINSEPWILVLLLAALLTDVALALRQPRLRQTWPGYLFAAVLVYLVPCLIVLLAQLHEPRALLVALAIVSCVAGKSVEQRLHDAPAANRRGASRSV